MAASVQTRNSRELSERQAYIGLLGRGIFQGGDWGDFKSNPNSFELRDWWKFKLKYWWDFMLKDWWDFVLRDW